MAADIAANSEENTCLSSGRLADVESCVMEAMVQSVSKFEGKVESSMHSSYPWKILVPAERAKLPSKCKDTSRKMRDCCKLDCTAVVQVNTCHDATQRVGTGDHKAEVEISFTEETRAECPQPDGISEKSLPSISNSEYHVLTVDDSKIDQKVIERLLKTSSYKGMERGLHIFLLLYPWFRDQLVYHCHEILISLSRMTNQWGLVTCSHNGEQCVTSAGISWSF